MSIAARIYVGSYQLHFDKREDQWVLVDRRTAKIVMDDEGKLPRAFKTEKDARDWGRRPQQGGASVRHWVWWMLCRPAWWVLDAVCWAVGHRRPRHGALYCSRCGRRWWP